MPASLHGPLSSRLFGALAALLLLLSVLAWAYGTQLSALLPHNAHGHAHMHAHGHPFVDARSLWRIPNAADVLSNAAFLIPGLLGLLALRALRNGPLAPLLRRSLALFFVGLWLVALGSGIYHWAPSAWGLALDRLGMAVAFAGLLTAATAERLDERAARWMLALSLPLALAAAVLPAVNGNVLPWALVQGGGMLWLLTLALLRRPGPQAAAISLLAVLAWYALAKLLESADAAVFAATGELVSGHTLKHLAAAAAAWPAVAALRRVSGLTR